MANPKPHVKNLSLTASRGVFWSGMSVLTVSLLQFITTAVLARFLTPTDFGTVGMATLVGGMVSLFGNLGLGAALVQRKNIEDIHLSTVFCINLTVGIILCVISIALSPIAAEFFHNPLVKGVIFLLAFNFIIGSLSSVNSILLTKNIEFKKIAFVEITAAVFQSVTAIILALSRYGLWSIVIGIIFGRIITTILNMIMHPWIPSLRFSSDKFHELFRFGRNLFGESLINYFNANSDYLITGRLLGATSLGYYQFAYRVPHLVLTNFSQTITRVLFPVFSKIQDNDEKLRRGYIKILKIISIVTFPATIGLMVIANEFVTVVYGEKWLPVVIPLQILCFSAMVKSVFTTMGSVFNSKGRPDLGFKWNLVILPITVTALIIGSYWDVNGVAMAMTVTAFISIIAARIAANLIGLSFFDYLKSFYPALSGSLIMVLSLLLFKRFFINEYGIEGILALLSMVIVGALIYFLSIRLLWYENFNEVKLVILDILKR